MERRQSILSNKSQKFKDKVKQAPLLPGCYIFKDSSDAYIYIGKAKVLRNRVRSYFSNYNRLEERTQQMINQAVDVEYITVDSEIEALILESNLIKKYDPHYNILLKDDKGYVYVKFDHIYPSRNKTDWQGIPTISVVRKTTEKRATYFGPYPSAKTVRRLLRRLRRVFPYCTSKKQVIIPKDKNQLFMPKSDKPCFYYHIDLCNGICFGKVTREEYEKNLQNIKKFFQSQKVQLLGQLEHEMQNAAKHQNFEKAASIRDRIQDLRYVGRSILVEHDMDDIAVITAQEKRRNQALSDLVERLKFPADKLKLHQNLRIECYDISNIQGSNATGSMVVFINGKPKPELYRRFRIKYTAGPNDFAMLQEVLTRRFRQYLLNTVEEYTDNEGFTINLPKDLEKRMKNWKTDESFKQLPDLMIIDGGKGQLSSTYQILHKFGLADTIPIIGLAKREEEIFKIEQQPSYVNYLPVGAADELTKIRLPRRSESLYLIQRIRDEAHRFAVTYHRKLRSRQMLQQNDTKKQTRQN